MISLILNLPYSIFGLLLALISIPVKKINFQVNPYAIILNVRNFWWRFGYIKNARAMAIGNIVLLGPDTEDRDLEHELVHVEQYQRMPLIHPFLYYLELYRKGYKNNKYEIEAYSKAGNVYRGK